MRYALLVLATLCASSLAAQPLTVGVQIADAGGTATITSAAPVSYINLADSATAAGTVNKASVSWSRTCSGAFKVVFLRQAFSGVSSFSVIASRGPFDAVSGRNDVTLTPPVAVSQGDLIAVVQLQPLAACGSVRTQSFPGTGVGYNLVTTSDISLSGTIGMSSNYSSNLNFGAIAYNSDPVLARVLPAAGAVQGSSAFFRTSLQLLNPTASTITGTLVFHKQGQPAAPSDPSLAFTLASNRTLAFSDVVTSMGSSGLGSLDIMTNGAARPIVSARVFSDGGSAGTSGFSEEGLVPEEALDTFSRGILLIPADLTNFRMNIGVRTLDPGATLTITMLSAGGSVSSTRSGVVYPPNFFSQVSATEFTGASALEAGGWIVISSGFPSKFFVYSSVIDNRTSDSTYRLADIR